MSESSPASIEQLPIEILVEIFMFCLPSGRWAYYEPNTEDAPWVLAQVCSPWRATVLSTPQLWQTLTIDLSQLLPDEMEINDDSSSDMGPSDDLSDSVSAVGGQSQQNLIHLVGLFVERSGSCPFTLIFSWRGHAPCELHPVLSQVVEMLTRTSHRWGNLTYELPLPVLVNLPSVKGRVQSLRTLEISPCYNTDEGAVIDEFVDAPLLQSVNVFVWQSPIADPAVVKLPLAQLTSYTGCFRHLSDIFDTLREMPNIVVCDIMYNGFPVSDTGDNYDDLAKIPPLAHLRRLIVHQSSEQAHSHYISRLTDRLTLPQLEYLEVDCDNEVFPHLTALVVRSACQLRTFSVNNASPQFNDAVFVFFAHVPTVTELTLWTNGFTSTDMARLTRPTPPVPCPLPALRVLNMSYAQLPAAEFVQMIESRVDNVRRAGGACLEALRVTNYVLERKNHLLLLSLRRLGLRVEVVDQYDREMPLAKEEDKEREEEDEGEEEGVDNS